MEYKVNVINNSERDSCFKRYSDALDYCDVLSKLFCIPISLFKINNREIGYYKLQNVLYRGNVRGI